ncbi:MAG TPA: TIGR00725 family protein [bacterium]|nr:TIGR00725 family protein [bacterium]
MFENYRDKKIIAVIGGRDTSPEIYQQAEEVGRLIAESGNILINGGRTGIMEASSKGAHLAKGLTIGILPGKRKDGANKWVDVVLTTGIGLARNAIIVNSCDAAIAIDGRYGTLSEIAYCFQFDKPVCSLSSWNIEGVTSVSNPEEAVNFALESCE